MITLITLINLYRNRPPLYQSLGDRIGVELIGNDTLNYRREIETGREMKQYSLTLQLGLSQLPHGRQDIMLFGSKSKPTSTLAVDTNGTVLLFGDATQSRLQPGRIHTIRLCYTRLNGYGYLLIDGKIAKYFLDKSFQTTLATATRFHNCIVSRIELSPDVPLLVSS